MLGGTHEAVAEARARSVALGASAAVNLSASVSDVVVLPGGETDRRMTCIALLGLRVHDADWSRAPVKDLAGGEPEDTLAVLVRGGVLDLPVTGTVWTVAATWRQQVPGDDDFAFYGVPEHPDGTVRLAVDGPTEQTVAVDLERLPLEIPRATLDAATTERTMILAELYRRGEGRRLRAVGQGYDHGLADLARGYGVDVAE